MMNRKSFFLKFTTLIVVLLFLGCKKEGCTDSEAENFNKKADIDDGSCIIIDSNTIAISEDITIPTILKAATYRICSDINIRSELTLMPGTILLMCEGSSISVTSDGMLTAMGTADSTISIKGELNSKGYWVGLGFKSNSINNQLKHVTISDGGSYDVWENATVFVDDEAEVAMEFITISNSSNFGLYLENDALLNAFKSNTFGSCSTGISLSANQVYFLDSNSIYNNSNINNFIDVRSDTIQNLQLWEHTNSPLLIHGLTVQGGLVLLPKANLIMNSAAQLSVIDGGYLSAIGTSESPISIKGRSNSAGYWQGLRIESVASENEIAHTIISDAGSSIENKYSNLFLSGRLDISNATIKNANSYGIYVKSGASLYSNNNLILTASQIENSVSFIENGSGLNANCSNNCTAFFE
ncbi:MAG: hypothetical protein AB8B72_08305 [Crocinitomicaceae bacterium]